MDDLFYTAAILRERSDLLERHPTGVQLEHFLVQYDGKPVRSIGVVLTVEWVPPHGSARRLVVMARDEESGQVVQYLITPALLATLPFGPARSQFERWRKGQKVIVEGCLRWREIDATPIVEVSGVRYS
ncbi:MAG: hypothetical protein AB7T63_06040 [Planctomycetota bacterium]